MEPSNEVKIAILKDEQRLYTNSIYQLTMRAKIAKDIGDDIMKEKTVPELERMMKYNNAFENEIKKLEENKEIKA